MEFMKHPSRELQEIFENKPYQIQEPEKAKFIFLGRDANFDPNIENDESVFEEFKEYLKDGVSYWKTHDYHTPMLGKNYKGDGKRYHIIFHKLDLSSADAENVSFIELIKFPTAGMSSGKKQYLDMVLSNENKSHLERIKKIQQNQSSLIFIPKGLVSIISKLQLFNVNSPNIIIHTHFSSCISNDEINELNKIIKSRKSL